MATTPTIRRLLTTRIGLVADVGAQIGISDDQLTALRAGDDAVVTSAQLRDATSGHPSMPTPAELDATAAWTLSGENTLTPAP